MSKVAATIDLAYFELGLHPEAHSFAKRFIARDRLQIVNLLPHRTALVRGDAGADVAYDFDLKAGGSFRIVGATFRRAAGDLICGLRAGLYRSGAHAPYPWDVVISGRRNADVDPTLGPVMQTQAVYRDAATTFVMPLFDWSDEDVAHLLRLETAFAPDARRYWRKNGKLETRSSPGINPDYASACISCFGRAGVISPHLCPLKIEGVSPPLNDNDYYAPGEVPPFVML